MLSAKAVAAMILALNTLQDDMVTRRGSEPTLIGKITSIDESGITVRSASGAEHSVTWDRVRDIGTSDPSIQRSVDAHRHAAERLWRARLRLERGDTALAEPLFERLFAEYRGRTHETALIVAEGLLRCRLSRAAHDAALIPALEASRLRRKGISTTAYDGMPALFDEATQLCMKLPPAWVVSAGLARVESELKTYDALGDPAIAAIAAMYRVAVRQHLGLEEDAVTNIAADHNGVVLMRLLTSCTGKDPDRRTSARSTLQKMLADLPGWAQAWARYAMGRSLLLDSDDASHDAALVSLSYLPATYQREQPYLAALALATLCTELQRMGAADEAAILQSELTRQYPNHPALSLLETTSSIAPLDQTIPALSRDRSLLRYRATSALPPPHRFHASGQLDRVKEPV